MKFEHRPTKDIPKDMKYQVKCKCGNITAASNDPIPVEWKLFMVGVPCSVCKRPMEYLNELIDGVQKK